jgi:hypothetical protein
MHQGQISEIILIIKILKITQVRIIIEAHKTRTA